MKERHASPLDIQDFLEAATEAGRRSRTVTILLAVGSVLLFAGLLNSLQSDWMRGRLVKFRDINNSYVADLIGSPPATTGAAADQRRDPDHPPLSLYERRYLAMDAALMKSFVENSLVINVPFFGFSFDVNDLGLLGGLAFVVLLSVYRFALSRELDNIRIGFLEAKKLGQLKEFYTLLAMHQVFTIPWTPGKTASRFLDYAPKCVCLLPILIQLSVVTHDAMTYWVGHHVDSAHVHVAIAIESILLVALIPLSAMALSRLNRIDALWDRHADELEDTGNAKRWRRRRIARLA